MSGEPALYSEGGVVVTRSRVEAGGEAFAVAAITSVRVAEDLDTPAGRAVGLAMLACFALAAAAAYLTMAFLPPLLIVAAGVALGVASRSRCRAWQVVLTTAAGERPALRGASAAAAARFRDAVLEAVASR